MSKKIFIAIIATMVLLVFVCTVFVIHNESIELKTIHSESQLRKIYNLDQTSTMQDIFSVILGGPFYILDEIMDFGYVAVRSSNIKDYTSSGSKGWVTTDNSSKYDPSTFNSEMTSNSSSSSGLDLLDKTTSSSKDYSTTNIQVENVDEADITKTDGDYIYSISDDNVIITNVINPQQIKIEATIKSNDGSIPEDLILYKDKLVIIAENSISSSNYNYNSNTIVKIYDITNKARPIIAKSFELYEPYYTSRCINNQLYIISSGRLRKNDDKIERTYKEEKEEYELPLNKIKYLKDVKTNMQTLIAVQDLDETDEQIELSSYQIDISNAYVSENGIYLLDEKYTYNDEPTIFSILGYKGIFGLLDYEDNYNSTQKTEIYKFNISKDGNVEYLAKTSTDGKTINQYSLDEKQGHLRVALYDTDGARVEIFDENLNLIGKSSNLAKGEKMYSSRFMGDKAYLVTYKTVDPLFVIDLSNEEKPKVLGELKIPGYSTYLHPYDENHIIGIGMQTQETVNKNSSGKVTSTTARITGMKMALFDITDVRNPEQISETVIGDSRTTSAILTNPKALLFSKEKQLIAIPVNNYEDDFSVSSSTDSYSSTIDAYKNYNKKYVAEGYFVYRINLDDGFKLKGVITHEAKNNSYKDFNFIYYSKSKLLRGMYIENNLYTVSENAVKVNNIETMDLICELKLK